MQPMQCTQRSLRVAQLPTRIPAIAFNRLSYAKLDIAYMHRHNTHMTHHRPEPPPPTTPQIIVHILVDTYQERVLYMQSKAFLYTPKAQTTSILLAES